ncbi:uncharacterized protein spmip4 isoform X2 [Vanacampus margaritifer]
MFYANTTVSFRGGIMFFCLIISSKFLQQMESPSVNNSIVQTVSHCDISDATKKSDAPLSDQLERAATTAITREHPYASHISRFEMFPSFRSSGDHRTGFREARFPFISPNVPPAPKVTVICKTKGGPYRHEILEPTTRAKVAKWTGDFSVVDCPKPVRGVRHALYPPPTRAIVPNDLAASERTSNTLESIERMQWITSYQMHYKGFHHTVKNDDFKGKTSDPTRKASFSTRLGTERDRAAEVPVASKPRQAAIRRQGRHLKSTYADILFSVTNQGATSPQSQSNSQTFPQDIVLNSSHTLSGGTEAIESNQVKSKEGAKVHFDENRAKAPVLTIDRDVQCNPSQLCVLPGITPVERTVSNRRTARTDLARMQADYTRSKAHRIFNDSIKYPSLDMRDHLYTGKQHEFFGLNANIIHG